MRRMRKFSQINESLEDSIDVQSEINEFIEKMGKAYHDRYIRGYGEEGEEAYTKSMNEIENLATTNPTNWDIWEVYETDDYGRNSGTVIHVKAVSKLHARLKASTIKNNLDIIATGFYSASKIGKSAIEATIAGLERRIEKLKNIQ
jgi:hypothetical protein